LLALSGCNAVKERKRGVEGDVATRHSVYKRKYNWSDLQSLTCMWSEGQLVRGDLEDKCKR